MNAHDPASNGLHPSSLRHFLKPIEGSASGGHCLLLMGYLSRIQNFLRSANHKHDAAAVEHLSLAGH